MKANLLRELARVFLHEADTKPDDEGERLADISETLYARANAPPPIVPRRAIVSADNIGRVLIARRRADRTS